jgi:hypothetical protein
MNDTDYNAILDGALAKLEVAMRQKSDAEIEVGKLKQFIYATMNMLSDEQRVIFMAKLDQLNFDDNTRAVGLKEAITRVLAAQPKKWFTVTKVRDQLLETGFDFRNYTANPLASVSTTLKRMKPEEVETTTIEGVTAYQWRRVSEPRRRSGHYFGAADAFANMTSEKSLLGTQRVPAPIDRPKKR